MISSNVSSLTNVPDDELLRDLEQLVGKDQQLEAELLAHLAEVDARKLYLREACSSMFAYCTRVLHFSEYAAYNRIAAARVANTYPVILERLRAGHVHLTGVNVLAPHLTRENHLDLLSRAKHQSKRSIEELLADLRPRPAVKPIVRRLPPPRVNAPAVATEEALPKPQQPASAARPRPVPLGQERFKVQFTASRETHEKLCELQALLRHQIPDGDLGRIFDRAVDLLLENVKRKKFAETARPRAHRSGSKPSRHIPAEIKRAVAARDGGQCRYVSASGRRCGERELLEFHHVQPWALSQRHSVEELVLMCRAHNQYEAERVYGSRHMDRCRKLQMTTGPGTS